MARRKEHVFIADDQPEVRQLLAEKLGERGKTVTSFSTGISLLEQVEANGDGVELVVLDLDFGAGQPDGVEVLRRLKAQRPALPVIILTGKGSVETAVEAVQLGAADFIEKDLYIEDKLELSMDKVERMLLVLRDNARLEAENSFYRSELGRRYRIVSVSPKVEALLRQVEQIASIPRPVLIRGERGTGKELVAAALHYGGSRSQRPFVKLNCAAMSENLLESELFGHEKGAFTGATDRRPGRFELADGGTLFLDEIGNTAVEFQKNVLRVIEYQEFERIGGNRTIQVDVRVVAATNAPLEEEIEAGRFRADLYDRLRFSVLHLPPLRDRLEDVPPLVEFFTQQLCQEVASIPPRLFSEKALAAMEAYPWPGNVRELKFAVERALCVAQGDQVTATDLPAEVLGGSFGAAVGGNYDEQLAAFERGVLQRALAQANNSQKQAAEKLDISYDRFRHLLRKQGIIGK